MNQPQPIVLITGTSRGLGAHLERTLGDEGYRVYGSSRRGQPPQRLELDVTSPEQCERAVAEVIEREGRIDALINNAGSHLLGAALEASHAELRAQLELNFHGAVHMSRAVLPQMLERGQGRIINISSVGGRIATPFASAYNASKFALEGYMEALRLELLGTGVFVSNLEPGFLRTGTTETSVVATAGEHERFTAARRDTHDRMLRDAGSGASLQLVSGVVLRILRSPRPRLRYSVDHLVSRLGWLRALLPAAWFERMVVRATAPGLADPRSIGVGAAG